VITAVPIRGKDIYKGNARALSINHKFASIVVAAALRLIEVRDIFIAALDNQSGGVVQVYEISTGSGREH